MTIDTVVRKLAGVRVVGEGRRVLNSPGGRGCRAHAGEGCPGEKLGGNRYTEKDGNFGS